MTTRLIRMSAFLRRELLDVWRQPRLLLTLVIGPFVILGLFGAGLRDQDPPVRYIVTGPETGPIRELSERFVRSMPRRLRFQGYVADRGAAIQQLRDDRVDLVVSLPTNPVDSLVGGSRAIIRVYHDVVDPIETRAVELASRQAGDQVNRVLSRRIVQQGQDVVGDAEDEVADLRAALEELTTRVEGAPRAAVAQAEAELRQGVADLQQQLDVSAGVLAALDRGDPSLRDRLDELRDAVADADVFDAAGARDDLARVDAAIDEVEQTLAAIRGLPADIVISPFVGIAQRVGPGGIGLTAFYAPAVVVILVSHMLISFLTLSMVREQELGTVEIFRIAPLTPGEIVAGKYLAYLILGMATTAALVGLLVVGLSVPLRGSVGMLALGTLLTFAAAVALGLVLAMLAQSNSQAVQLAMLVLLASIFFSGFVLDLSRFHPPLEIVARALPQTYGVALFRDVMLRGRLPTAMDLGGLAAFAVAFTGIGWFALRRRLAPQ